MKISIITFTLGNRKYYLDRQIQFVLESVLEVRHHLSIEHFVVHQGGDMKYESPKQSFRGYTFEAIQFPVNVGIGQGLNQIVPMCSGDFILKLDDDAIPVNQGFFNAAEAICNRFTDSVWSPYPVGLINNPGGPKGYKHAVYQTESGNYTMRFVHHVGGFARFAPANLMKGFRFEPDLISGISGNEDGQFSAHCLRNNIPMFYLENGAVVEHAESTLGQIARYPEYFASRTNESNMKFEVFT